MTDEALYLYTKPNPPHCTFDLKLAPKESSAVLDYIRQNPGCTNKQITEGCNFSFHHQRTRRITDELVRCNLIEKVEITEVKKNYNRQKTITYYFKEV
jgi:hypothetical protein